MVSRGFIRSEARTGKTRERRYSREDVERLKRRNEERRDPEKAASHALQWGLPILESAIDAPPVSTDVAGLGTRVLVREDDGTEEAYTLVSPAEGSGVQAFHVVVPSLPGYAFSTPLGGTGDSNHFL